MLRKQVVTATKNRIEVLGLTDDELAAFDAFLAPRGGKRATYLREHVRSIIAEQEAANGVASYHPIRPNGGRP